MRIVCGSICGYGGVISVTHTTLHLSTDPMYRTVISTEPARIEGQKKISRKHMFQVVLRIHIRRNHTCNIRQSGIISQCMGIVVHAIGVFDRIVL